MFVSFCRIKHSERIFFYVNVKFNWLLIGRSTGWENRIHLKNEVKVLLFKRKEKKEEEKTVKIKWKQHFQVDKK